MTLSSSGVGKWDTHNNHFKMNQGLNPGPDPLKLLEGKTRGAGVQKDFLKMA